MIYIFDYYDQEDCQYKKSLLTVKEYLEISGVNFLDKIETIESMITEEQRIHFVCRYAKEVIPIYGKHHPDTSHLTEAIILSILEKE